MNIFIKTLVDNFSKHFYEKFQKEKYPNQDYFSCEFIYETCIKHKPDYVLDIGTNYGASALSLAFGLKNIGKNLNVLTTIDYSSPHWKEETPIIQKELLAEYKINMSEINFICQNFKSLKPTDIIIPDAKYIIFYDIHDTIKDSFVNDFFKEWVPLLKNSILMFHDVSVASISTMLVQDDPNYPRSLAKHFSGAYFDGFKECSEIVNWANEKKINLNPVSQTSVIWINL